jgi:hypothetical protein
MLAYPKKDYDFNDGITSKIKDFIFIYEYHIMSCWKFKNESINYEI